MDKDPEKTLGSEDFLWLHLKDLPYFRSILRAVEASFYQDIQLPHPILDVGSGDGHFASVAFKFKIDVGIDPMSATMAEAHQHGAYQGLVQADGGKMPFADNYFGSALSNSVLEHIEHVDLVLAETSRVLRSGAPFIFCVPNSRYFSELAISGTLRKVKLSGLGRSYENWFRRISRVFHANSPKTWQMRLENSGFKLEKWWHYFSLSAMRALEWGHFLGIPSLVVRKLTGKWILAPTRWNLALTEKCVRRFAANDHLPNGTFTFFVARKV
ncbi:MAG: class I SAM-dependent methyltransferase [Chloroflexi bacterium]|nr:class I SAM-dependent methyltransferase [Chloroflexota bacterium]